jgi:AmiR/NasT family two-component response regulator
MEKRKISENEAYTAMRRMAMEQGKSIKDVAESVLSVLRMLDG